VFSELITTFAVKLSEVMFWSCCIAVCFHSVLASTTHVIL